METFKLRQYHMEWGATYFFLCPGCNEVHSYDVRDDGKEPSWSFNLSMKKPTFRPSLLYPNRRCHLSLTDGEIQYFNDCTHSLAGQKVPLPDMNHNTYYNCEKEAKIKG